MFEQAPYARWVGATVGDYRLDDLLATSALGPLFAAKGGATRSAALIRVLAVPAARTDDVASTYQAHIERQASHITTLRHPHLLPLVSYGLYDGLPYLVWPQVTMRSLTARLAQSGPLDVVTVGRYLDQLAGALEYAHERATIHRNLSTDCIYLQLDGQLAVADFGARRIYELLRGDQAPRFCGSLEACAPEQLRGGRVDTYTDVYALGAVVYRLLTGEPPFSGETVEALAEQHLHAPPPPLARWRAGLPAELDEVLAVALAKDPAQRFQHPGALANAYNRVVAPASATRVPFAENPISARERSRRSPVSAGPVARGNQPPEPRAQLAGAASGPMSGALSAPVAGSLTNRAFRLRGGRLLVAGALLVALLSGGLFLVAGEHLLGGSHPTGTVSFLDSSTGPAGNTDALRLDVHGLDAPAQGSRYKAWLINQTNEHVLALGTLTPAAGHAYALTYASARGSGQAGVNLLTLGDKIEITVEQRDVPAPVGHVVVSAAFPPEAFVHIQHLLVSFPTTPNKIGLLVGMRAQIQAMEAQATALRSSVTSGNTEATRCLAQSILDISEGTKGLNYQPLGAACVDQGISQAGDGYGLLGAPSSAAANGGQSGDAVTGYLDGAADHASLAATTPDSTAVIRRHASQVEAAIVTIKGQISSADAAALKLLKTPTDAASATAVETACDQAYHGTSTSGASTSGASTSGASTSGASTSGAGALSAYAQGQLMATLSLVAQS